VVGSPLKESFQGINLWGGSNGAVDWTHADELKIIYLSEFLTTSAKPRASYEEPDGNPEAPLSRTNLL
jgi:hypothetical protein